MLSPENLHSYQRRGVQHILEHPNAMLWLDMGLGKTVISLTALEDLFDQFTITGALVVAPKRVIQSVWRQEAKQWSHTGRLRFALVHGTAQQRTAALRRKDVDIWLINYENLVWLKTQVEHFWLSRGRYPPFDTLILDEVTKVKNPTAKRTRALMKLRPYFRRAIGLTGEPAPKGYEDLFGQYLVVDGGQRLGKHVTQFREAYFTPAGFNGFQRRLTPYGQRSIENRVHDITLQMSADDYLDLPPVIENDIWVDLPPEAERIYRGLEDAFFAELSSGRVVEAFNAGSKGIKCLQVANGAVYVESESDAWEAIHDAKLDALDDLMEEQAGQPVLLAYAFRHDAARIKARYPEAEHLSSALSEREITRILDAWDRREIPLLYGHPASMGHGLNLQNGSSTLCWFGLNYSLELYRQFNARLAGGHRRRGRVMMHRIKARGTLDVVVQEVLNGRLHTQQQLKHAIQQLRERRAA